MWTDSTTLCHFLANLLWTTLVVQGALMAQSPVLAVKEVGLPYIQNFSPKEYGAHSQNWSILQDQRGIMYFANTSGILEYDGVSWREISTPGRAIVFSLAIDPQGRIYGGGRGDFGYLTPDSVGQLYFVSLMENVPSAYQDFSAIRQVYATPQGVYFNSPEYLFCWHKNEAGKDTLRVWQPETRFQRCYVVRDTIYIVQPEIGLMKMVGDSLHLVSDAELFANAENGIYCLLPFPAQSTSSSSLLVGSRTQGLFVYEGTTLQPFPTEPVVKELIVEKQLYDALWLSDGQLALVLRQGGVAFVNQQGALTQLLNEQSGLRNEEGRSVLQDRQGGLWVALNNGLGRVEIPSPISYFDKTLGLEGGVNDIVRHEGQLYAATNLGLYRLWQPDRATDHPYFQYVEGLARNAWSLLSMEDGLWVASGQGVFRITHDRIIRVMDENARFLYRSPNDPNLLLVGLNIGLALVRKIHGQWRFIGRVAGISEEVRTIVEDQQSNIWLGTSAGDGYLRVRLKDTTSLGFSLSEKEIEAVVERYQQAQGVPGGYVRVYPVDGRVIFATDGGLKRFDETLGLFVPDTSLGERFADTTQSVSKVVEDKQSNIWIKSTLAGGRRETGVLMHKADGGYTYHNTAFMRIAGWGSVYTLYADPLYENVLWIGGPEGIVRYNHNIKKDYKPDFRTLVREVTVSEDSLLFAGIPIAQTPTLTFADNSIRFAFAATSFEQSSANRYQFFLEGFDKNWSGWTDETRKDYTNLPEGNYTFRVHARNLYGHLSEEDTYSFTILPPWHRTWWGYLLQSLLVFGLIFSFVWWRLQTMYRRNQKLEQVVIDRTAELAEKNEQLREMDTIKSRFFANISHEFRTPLTLVMGQIESVLPELKKSSSFDKLKIAHHNAAQLQRLINQLLDLSKFESGKMKLQAFQQNIVPLLKHLTCTFESLADQKNIKLRFESVQEPIMAYIDQDKLEKIMYNLLSNALKFTLPGGYVLVKADVNLRKLEQQLIENKETIYEKGDLRVTIRDSGIGIPSSRLPHIFDRFYQVDSSQTREFEGTGIGLALTKELVQLHGGGISVESSEGFGTTFIVTLPLGKAHLHPEQIVEASEDFPRFQALSAWEISSGRDKVVSGTEPSLTAGQDRIDKDIVLIVDDNPDMRTYIREGLEQHYFIIEASHGEEGLSKAQETIPDLIITDVMMPKVDGYALTHKIRQHTVTSHIPIIMLTAKASEEDKLEGLEKGVDAYLTKPFNKKELQIRVRKLIALRKQLRQQAGTKAVLAPSDIVASSMDQQFLQRIQDIVEKNIENEGFSVDDLALEVGVSRRQLQRKLKALTDNSPQQCIRIMRLGRARQLLEQGAGTVTEIAFQVGYGDITAFSKAFQAEFSQAPSAVLQKRIK